MFVFAVQDFVSIDEAGRRYSLYRKTIYNDHHKKYITVHSSESKTFVDTGVGGAYQKKLFAQEF